MTRTRQLLLGSATVLLAVAGPSCDLTGSPQPGQLVVSLTTPNTGDAGILFTISGDLTGVSATGTSNTLYWRLGSGETRVLLFGNLPSGPLATIDVPDVKADASYSSIVLDVTDRSNNVRASLAGYEISFTRAAGGS